MGRANLGKGRGLSKRMLGAGSGERCLPVHPRATAPCSPLRVTRRVDLRTGAPLASKSMSSDALIVRGAREHNLKNISVEIPRNSLTVITGLSGSGKSSLAFDTIYAEGQRRYVESLSAYARQFLGLMDEPDVDAIE